MSIDRAPWDAITRVAKAQGLEPAALLAIAEVESGGRVSAIVNGRHEPLIRIEGHYFDRLLPDAKRALARAEGLAHPKAGRVKNPKSQAARWAMLRRMMAIDEDAALMSVSWGIGQVMGAHAQKLGYANVQALVAEARSGVEGQMRLMLRYIRTFGLLDELQRHDWTGFARGYNGPAYAKWGYHKKIAAAYARYNGAPAPKPASSGMLRLGSKGQRVRELQALLARAGYAVKVDGDFGPATKAALKGFQTANRLTVDGVAGPETMRALAAYKAAPDETVGETPTLQDKDVIAPAGGGVGGGITVETVKQQVENVLVQSGHAMPDWLFWTLTGLSAALVVGGLAWAGWSWWRKRRTHEGDEDLQWSAA